MEAKNGNIRRNVRPRKKDFVETYIKAHGAKTLAQKTYEKLIKLKAKKFSRGNAPKINNIKYERTKKILKKADSKFKEAEISAVKAELLLQNEPGLIVPENELERTYKVKQDEIVKQSSLVSNAKFFSLVLDVYGPYHFCYSRNGRYILVGGNKGHVALFDWYRDRLFCEFNVNENVRDVVILHNETLFAVAQKNHVYIYDKKGAELHRLDKMSKPIFLEFLPYHLLLVSANRFGHLIYQDVSTGGLVSKQETGLGIPTAMCQNPSNGVIILGHSRGVVTMWAPLIDKPLMKMLCHQSLVLAMVVEKQGKFMVTSGEDGYIKIWDLKTFQAIQTYRLVNPVRHLALSQRNLLAFSQRSVVYVWKDFLSNTTKSCYMKYTLPMGGMITGIEFCPFEDVLGIVHEKGFESIIVPGAGEPNFDVYYANPYETKSQRREATVQKLLDKLQPELICLDPGKVGTVIDERVVSRDVHIKNQMTSMNLPAPTIEPKDPLVQPGPEKKKSSEKKQPKDQIQNEIRFSKQARNREMLEKRRDETVRKYVEQEILDEGEGYQSSNSCASIQSALDRFSNTKKNAYI